MEWSVIVHFKITILLEDAALFFLSIIIMIVYLVVMTLYCMMTWLYLEVQNWPLLYPEQNMKRRKVTNFTEQNKGKEEDLGAKKTTYTHARFEDLSSRQQIDEFWLKQRNHQNGKAKKHMEYDNSWIGFLHLFLQSSLGISFFAFWLH